MAAEDVYRKLRITDSIYIEGDLTVLGDFTFGDVSTDSLTVNGKLILGTATTNAINVSVPMTSEQGWNVGVVLQHGSMAVPLDYGTVAASDLVLMETSVEAIATGQWVIGQVNQLSTAGASTGYFLGGYNYILLNHNAGAGIAFYSEVDMSGTSAFGGNVQGLFSEMIVAAGSVITGAGKISGLTVEMNVVATATVANPVIGIEVDMRDVKVDCAGEMIGIKVTKAGAGNYLDYGLKFSNQFENVTAVIGFDLTQGNVPVAMLCETATATLTTFAKFTNSTGAITNLFDFTSYGSGEGEIIEKDANAATDIWGKIKIINTDGAAGYINVWSTPN